LGKVRQMTEEMIKQYFEHHFELNPDDDFKMEPAKQDAS
jgi:putative transposase